MNRAVASLADLSCSCADWRCSRRAAGARTRCGPPMVVDAGLAALVEKNQMALPDTKQCGHSLFKAYRLAWGWSVPEAVEAFHTMCRGDKLKPRGLVARS